MLIVRDFSNRFQEISGMPLSGAKTKQQLKLAGIDTSSRQYKAAIKSMTSAAKGGVGYTNVECIKNSMRHYDKDGDYINPSSGLAGLLVTDQNRASMNRIVSIPESSKDEMFESTKREFLRENGILNGDTTKRSEIFTNLYRKMPKNDRLAAGHTLEEYERQYRQAFIDTVKAADPKWEIGKQIQSGVLDHITRESIDSTLAKGAFDKRV